MNKLNVITVLLASSVLTACGGGGGSSITTPPLTSTSTSTSTSTPAKLTLAEQASAVRKAITATPLEFTHITQVGNDIVLFRDNFDATDVNAQLIKFDDEGNVTVEDAGIQQVPRGTIVADFDNDGIQDVYAFSHGREWGGDKCVGTGCEQYHDKGYRNTLFSGITGGYDTTDFGAAYTHSSCSTDINGDGYLDIVDNNIYYERGLVRTNNGNGTFTVTNLPVELTNKPTTWCTGGDFNNDGYGDVVLGTNSFGGHTLLLSNGTDLVYDSFPESPSMPSGVFYQAPATVGLLALDFNGDNCLDLVSHTTDYNQVSVITRYIGDCNGNLTEDVLYVTDAKSYMLSVQDLTGDGTLDVYTHGTGVSSSVDEVVLTENGFSKLTKSQQEMLPVAQQLSFL